MVLSAFLSSRAEQTGGSSRLISEPCQSQCRTAVASRAANTIICSVFEDKNKLEVKVGLAFINLGTGEIILSEILDSQTYVRTIHKLQVFDPNEVLVPAQSLRPSPNKMAVILGSNLDESVKINGVEKKHYSESYGLESIEEMAFEKDVNYLKEVLDEKIYALRALAGGLRYLKLSSKWKNIEFRQYRFRYEVPESTMFIDSTTIKSLELLENLEDKHGTSLYKFLNSTKTKMGERTLKNNILQPLTDKGSIVMRSGAVKELMEKNAVLLDVRLLLKDLQDLDKLFALLLMKKGSGTEATHLVNQVILFKQAAVTAQKISQLLEGTTSPLLQQIQDICGDPGITEVKDIIDECINEDCNWASGPLDLRNQRMYAVKAGRNGLIDISRQAYKASVDQILQYIEEVNEAHENLQIEQSYNSRRGFFLKVQQLDESELPEVFINTKSKKTYKETTTLELVKANARLDDIAAEILMLSENVLDDLTNEIVNYLPVLFMTSEALAILDLLQSFAETSLQWDYIVPEITGILTIRSAKHPILQKMIPNFIPNAICSVQETSRFQVITGTNMSGKSVYMKQVSILVIMAQMGCLVPAEYASFPLYNNLRARLCVDNFATTSSSFTTEMNEILCVIEDADEKSLIIIDELGRGSSLNDGFTISLAICEHLLNTNATIFLSTHFHKLSKIMGTKQGVLQNHMSSSASQNGTLKMNYRITSGIIDIRRYGVKIATKFFDQDVINRAYEISKKLEELSADVNSIDEVQLAKERKILNLVKILQYAVEHDEVSRPVLLLIQDEFLAE
ncbi:DNA mismatch repair protein [Wickerhamomyces ciferrii]|uniref:DNA mismatch repair protein n=1 Tax=Wickerhamomyces ciferrii (strain ATCC 14091 / BCRC 22168 / CBS 111 / JCM 3599 / NBRC 0793 / NRRL Y-1031 F-60-10) TaxID=1206466 RepID=K0KTX7_WICCF|nr:DNA mismatch repair protein [Wickerhamomyces ciferrii]CCH46636.1 DNA mismatch repair protein [Wickerhamomyces ciferrii]